MHSRDIANIVADTRTFGFVDILGYGHIVAGTQITDAERIPRIVEVWECFNTAVTDCKTVFPDADTVLFSDSLYVAHMDPLAVAAFLCSLYVNVATFYRALPDHWMPWLRAGMKEGWAIDVRDPTVPFGPHAPMSSFRNPVGPGPARAYYLAEKTGLKGARGFADQATCTSVAMSIAGVTVQNSSLGIQHAATVLRPSWPAVAAPTGRSLPCPLYELPWWRFLTHGCREAETTFRDHAWQVTSVEAKVHLDATLQVLAAGG